MAKLEIHEACRAILLERATDQAQVDAAADVIERIVAVRDNRTSRMVHTLALAHLRTGRFGTVEALCRESLGPDVAAREQATSYATIALAQTRLGQDATEAIHAALALDPGDNDRRPSVSGQRRISRRVRRCRAHRKFVRAIDTRRPGNSTSVHAG
jgi:hypothetical protein